MYLSNVLTIIISQSWDNAKTLLWVKTHSDWLTLAPHWVGLVAKWVGLCYLSIATFLRLSEVPLSRVKRSGDFGFFSQF